ncbi:MAG: 50S ribosomal protein L21 [Chloroflexi bacterium]|nr:50S ribosomal protein L21 [Chloroflexota bacterium]MYI04648.1 50S ribosomal protein L21 [Chloroflexota bacterium]
MYAVIRSGGKQYRVSPGQRLKLERFDGEAGDRVTFSDVLLVSGGGEVAVGAPTVESASVTGEIVEQGRGRKIRVFKYKNKTRYRRLRGHRQLHTDVRVDEVSLGDQTWTAPVAEAPAATAAEEVEEAVSLDESTDEPIAEVEEDDAPEASVDESGGDAEDTED